MTKDEALKLALEALESLQGGCTDSDDGTVEAITVWCPEVIDAIREALAQPQQEPDLSGLKPETQKKIREWIEDGSFIERAINVIDYQERLLMYYEKAQPQQEPVAWMYPSDYEKCLTSEHVAEVTSIKCTSFCTGETTTIPLYTTPQARKPLTLLMITTAYEQGVGKGHQAYRRKEEIKNPYTPGDCHEAWRLGYKEGKTQAGDIKDAPARKPLTDDFLQANDYRLLHRFIETTEDDQGYDIGKGAIKRLAELGVVRAHGFGKYSVTMFGYWVHERYWEQDPSLPLKTNADRAIEAAHGIKENT